MLFKYLYGGGDTGKFWRIRKNGIEEKEYVSERFSSAAGHFNGISEWYFKRPQRSTRAKVQNIHVLTKNKTY